MTTVDNRPHAIIIEDKPNDRAELKRILEEEFGFNVVATLATYAETLEYITSSLAHSLVSIVLLDGNLSPPRFDGADGRRLAVEIRAVSPSAKIVGISNDEDQQNVDVWTSKNPDRFRRGFAAFLAKNRLSSHS